MSLELNDTVDETAELVEKAEGPTRTSLQFANELIVLEPWISHLKLQKITYAAYGWHFVVFKTMGRLFDEHVQAWRYGPVFPKLYRHLRHTEFMSESPFFAIPVTNLSQPEQPAPRLDYSGADAYLEPFVKWVSERYRPYTGIQLAELTHRKDSPWSKVKDRSPDKLLANHISIPDKEIIKEFEYLKRPQK